MRFTVAVLECDFDAYNYKCHNRVELRRDRSKLESTAIKQGWQKIRGKFYCPDCKGTQRI